MSFTLKAEADETLMIIVPICWIAPRADGFVYEQGLGTKQDSLRSRSKVSLQESSDVFVCRASK